MDAVDEREGSDCESLLQVDTNQQGNKEVGG
jgi:hypothetical protein